MHTHNNVCQTCELTFMTGHVNACLYLWKLETWRFIRKGRTVIVSLVFLDFPRVPRDCLHLIDSAVLSEFAWVRQHALLESLSYFPVLPFPTSNRHLLAFVLPQITYRLGYTLWLCSYLYWVNYDTFYQKKLGCCQILKQDHLFKRLHAGSTSSAPFGLHPQCHLPFLSLHVLHPNKQFYLLFIC